MKELVTVWHWDNQDVTLIIPGGSMFYLDREAVETLRWQLSTEYAEIQRNNELTEEERKELDHE
jgi:hypothetical protein